MADRNTSIPGNQILDDSITQSELDLTNTPTDGQIIKINMPAGDMTAIDLGDIGDISTMQTNIVLNAFRIAINGSLTQFNMVDGIVDEYEDENSVDNPNSTNEQYDAINDLYSPPGGIPSSEYSSDANTQLLLHMNGTDASTIFTDDGNTGHTITANGNAQLDTSEKQFGTASGLFDGTGDFLTAPDSSDWTFGDGNFTVDLWIRLTNVSTEQDFVGQWVDANNFWKCQMQSTGRLAITFIDSGVIRGNYNTASTALLTANTWHHLAFVRNGTSALIFVDGVSVSLNEIDAFSTNTVADLSSLLFIASVENSGGINFVGGRIDEFRISKGIARFTSNFDVIDNMTLISNPFTAEAQPDSARIVLFEEDIDSVTLNTDLKAFVTRDAGQTFTTDFATDDKLDITSHGFANDDRIMVTSSSQDLPAGLDSATVYYVINQTTNDFELSLTSSGSAVDITDNGTGTHTAKQVTEITLANDGEYESGKNILTGSAVISGQPSGTSMEYQLVTANNKDLNIHGTGLSWD